VTTTRGELLADAIAKRDPNERATHIARHLESRLAEGAAREQRLNEQLRDAELRSARLEERLDSVTRASGPSNTLPAVATQAMSTFLATIGGYVIGKTLWLGVILVGVSALLIVIAGWRSAAPSRELAKRKTTGAR